MGFAFASFAESLSGTWDTTLIIQPLVPLPGFLTFDTTLTVTYEIGGWEFTSFTAIDETGWTDQTFSAEGALGAFSFGSTLDLDPMGPPYFTSWNVTGGVSIAGMTFDADFTLYPNDVRLVLGGSGSTGIVDIDVEMYFGVLAPPEGDGCDLNWDGVLITVDFPFCCAEVTGTIEFNCLGFVEASFCVTGIEVPNLPWLLIDACVIFTLDDKNVVLTPQFDFGADICFDLYIGYETAGNLWIGDLWIEGIGLTCEIGGVEFTGITFWDGPVTPVPTPPDLMGYYEMYKISTTDTACCGDFDFEIAVYFDQNNASLFEVALFTAYWSYELGENFIFSMGLEYDVHVPGLTKIEIGFEISW
jgi:hypothetical protein